MGDENDITVRVRVIESARHRGDSFRHIGEGLVDQVDQPRVGEVGVHLARESAGDMRPRVAPPTVGQLPFTEVVVDTHRDTRTRRDLLGRTQRRFQRRRPDGHDGPRAEVAPGAAGLLQAVRGEAEAGHRTEHDVVGVVDLGVADEMDESCHDLSLAGSVTNPG